MNFTPVAIWRTVTSGLRRMMNSETSDREISDEMEHFIEQATRDGISRGLAPSAAKREAQIAFGNTTHVKEAVRMSLWESSVTTFVADTRYAFRMLRRTPVFTFVIVLVISLGTGAVTTIFSAANALLLKPIAGAADGAQLIQIDRISKDASEGEQASFRLYEYMRDNNRTLEGVAAWAKADLTISLPTGGVSAYGNVVSANYFSVLGVRPALGRFFLSEEDGAKLAHPVVVVSYAFWQTHLNTDSTAIGTTVGVNGHQYTVVGVAPPGFHGVFAPVVTAAWVPLSMLGWVSANSALDNPNVSWLWEFARIKPNVSRATVQQDIAGLMSRYPVDGEPEWMKKYSYARLIPLTGLPDDAHKAMRGFLAMLLGASILVLIIASVNVAAMLSARAIARRREMALRIALGAQRARIIRQLLTESLVLFTLGAGGGIAIAIAATAALERISLPVDVPLSLDISPDVRVFAFALVVSLITGIVFGLAPALRAAGQDVTSRLRDDAPGSGTRRTVVGNVLVVGQIALSLVLLVSAGLLLRALDKGRRVDAGFDMNSVVTAPLNTNAWGYSEEKARQFTQQLREQVLALPGVTEVSYTSVVPLTMQSSGRDIDASRGAGGKADSKLNGVSTAAVDVGYFELLKLPLVSGRSFTRNDNVAAGKVAIINQTLAKKLWPNGDALGRTFSLLNNTDITVVGVVRSAKYTTLSEGDVPFFYLPVAQDWQSTLNVLVRFNGEQLATQSAIQRVMRSIDPALPAPSFIALAKSAQISLLPQRVAAMVAGSLGFVGLLLATVGLYGIISYSVSRRTREIGIRMALGAQRRDVQGVVVREGMQLAATGVVIGLLLSAAAARLLSSFLYGVSPLDTFTFTATPAILVCVALVASYLPARRASRADPMIALRST
jgi:predicted permease